MQDPNHEPARRHRVFVYGTLRRGERNHDLLATQCRLGACRSAPGFTLFDTGPYPAATRGGTTALVGEVYAVTPACFDALDRLEDYPRSYTRERIDTPYGSAWLYLWIRGLAPHWRRLHGDWTRRAAS